MAVKLYNKSVKERYTEGSLIKQGLPKCLTLRQPFFICTSGDPPDSAHSLRMTLKQKGEHPPDGLKSHLKTSEQNSLILSGRHLDSYSFVPAC